MAVYIFPIDHHMTAVCSSLVCLYISINQSITFNEHVTNVHAFNLYVNI